MEPAATDPEAEPPAAEQDPTSVPALMQQATVQQADIATHLTALTTLADPASVAAAAATVPAAVDPKALLAAAVAGQAAAVASFAQLIANLGLTLPAPPAVAVGDLPADPAAQLMTGLLSLLPPGTVPAQLSAPPLPSAPADLAKLLDQAQAAHAQALDAFATQLRPLGLDLADPQGMQDRIATLLPKPQELPPPSFAGLPGGDSFTAMLAGGQQLQQTIAQLIAKLGGP